MSGENTKMLAREAMLASIKTRDDRGLDQVSPVDVYALCQSMGIKVRFVDIGSMEGVYGRGEAGTVILLSSLRPLPRRVFTCAHELGHHTFGHGSKVDELLEEALGSSESTRKAFDANEFLAQSFAGFLLMPTLGVRNAFAGRGWEARTASPIQMYTVACQFGVGYETLIGHLRHSLNTLSAERAAALKQVGPKNIRAEILGEAVADPLIVADERWALGTLDAEVGTLLLLPDRATAENERIVAPQANLPTGGRLYRAVRPGVVRVTQQGTTWAVFVRVSNRQFVGFAEYRHLERADDDDV